MRRGDDASPISEDEKNLKANSTSTAVEFSPANTRCDHKAINSSSTVLRMSDQYAPSFGVFHQQQRHEEHTGDVVNNLYPTRTNATSMYPNFHNMPYYENQTHVPEVNNARLLPTSSFNHFFTVSGQQGRNLHPNRDSGFVYQQSDVACKPEDKGNSLKMERDNTSGAKKGRRKRHKYNKEIHTATCHDIISGRGHGVNRHAGNVKFREIISRYKLAYSTSSPPAKKQVTLQVLAEVQQLNPPGRFLVQNLEGTTWEELPRGQAKRKISQALREKPKKPGSGTKNIGFVSTSKTITEELENNSKDECSSSEEYDVDHDARSSDESDDESDSSCNYYKNRCTTQNNMNNTKGDDELRGDGNDESLTTNQQRFAPQSLPPLSIALQKTSEPVTQDQRLLQDDRSATNVNVDNYVQQLNQDILVTAGLNADIAIDNTFQRHMSVSPRFSLQTSSPFLFQSFAPPQMGDYIQLVNQHRECHPALMQRDFKVSNVPNPDGRTQDGASSIALSSSTGKCLKSNDDQTCAFVNYHDMSIQYLQNNDDNASIEYYIDANKIDSDEARVAEEFFQKMIVVASTCENLSVLYSAIRSDCESFSDFSCIFARRESTIQPVDNDVIIIRKEESLAGRKEDYCKDDHNGNQVIHIGNMRLAECIQLFSNDYGNPQVKPDETRANIVKTTLKSIINEGGRFLLKEKDKVGPTFEVLTEECTERILRSLFVQSCQYILFPTSNDVLLGRDGVSRLSQGNMFFKSIILANKSVLQTLTCLEDIQKVAIEIIFQIRARNGRFLMSCSQSGMWQILGHADAVEEVKQILYEECGRA